MVIVLLINGYAVIQESSIHKTIKFVFILRLLGIRLSPVNDIPQQLFESLSVSQLIN